MNRFSIIFLILLSMIVSSAGITHGQDSTDVCASVRYLMDRNITPYDLTIGGGVIQPDQLNESNFTDNYYADIWSFLITRPDPGREITLNITFSTITDNLNLEMQIFKGMRQLIDSQGVTQFQTIQANQTYSFPITRDGTYTLVVRRKDVSVQTIGNYAFTANFPGGGNIELTQLRDNSTNRLHPTPPSLSGGHTTLNINSTTFFTHPHIINSISSFNGTAAQLRFETITSGILINNWADKMHLLGGDLAVSGSTDNSSRLFYLQDYGYDIDMQNANLLNITDAVGTHWQLSWEAVSGVWISKTCAAVKLQNGQTFIGQLDDTLRDVTFIGTVDDFRIRLSPSSAINMSWSPFDPASTIELLDRQFHGLLLNDKEINLDSSQIDIRYSQDNTALAIQLIDRGASITLDWTNMSRFDVIGEQIGMWFLDAPRTHTTRSSSKLLSLEALDDIIHITYQNTADNLPGEQRLLLPASEGYIELVTPEGKPPFDGRSLPGQDGYAPRALNNTGGECYPINTMLEEVTNCPPNGHPNPANGNLWYAITDLSASGDVIDLNLTRSYNSRLSSVDGPFGPGWTNPYLVDYNAHYDQLTNSRIIDPTDVATYPVSLDLTWAPRGIVTLQTGSGSHHTFVSQNDQYIGGDLTAITMPNWTLYRADIRSSVWTLRQDNGLIYQFDRAGRLIEFGIDNRIIAIDYPHNNLYGSDATTPVIITDAPELRQIELYYDERQHIIRSILRDNTKPNDASSCTIQFNCHETLYTYDDAGYLIGVRYADGTQATYAYDDLGRLIQHQDPRAPIAVTMQYIYGDNGELEITVIEDESTKSIWRQLDAPLIDDQQRIVSLINEYGTRNTYTYAWTGGSLKSADNTFALIAETSPLNGTSQFESTPIVYTWENGLLQNRQSRTIGNSRGRNSLVLEYTANNFAIKQGYPELNINYQTINDTRLPRTITFADSSSLQFTYDARGWVQSMIDQNGGVYTYTWDDKHQLITQIRENDQTAIDYQYNAVGLITSLTIKRINDESDSGYTINFDYDGLGNLILVEHPTTGNYSINYESVEARSKVTVTDATRTKTISTFDTQGRLIEYLIMSSDNRIIRHETYTYDAIGRITAETKWLYPSSIDSFVEPQAHTTGYTYQALEKLPDATVINGYQITITDPYKRNTRYTYDAPGRVRQVEEYSGTITRYDYSTADALLTNGLRITQRDILNTQTLTITHYDFNLYWQLEQVTSAGSTWEFARENTRLAFAKVDKDGIAGLAWLPTVNGRPSGVNVVQTNIPLLSNTENIMPSPSLEVIYDFMGRPTQVTDDIGNVYDISYCPTALNTQKVIYSHPNTTDLTCDSDFADGLAYVFYYDAQNRITRTEGPNGQRIYDYVALLDTWQVDIASGDYKWQLRYNGVGELISWMDENGVYHEYEYDTLGRLRQVIVGGQPEASFTFYYNEINLLLSQLDNLRRGTRYVYDELGRLVVQQDARTANATIYGYNANGQLSTIISPLGNTTTLLYEDTNDRTRLTGIIDPTGATSTFQWKDRNQLIHTGPRGNQTTYTFDSFNNLWRIDDTLERSHEIHYDPIGNLSDWRQAQSQNRLAARHLILDWHSPLSFTVSESTLDWSRQFTTNVDQQITRIADSAGNEILFEYDSLGRLNNLSAAEQQWVLTYETGQPELTLTNSYGETQIMRFDALNRLTNDATTSYIYQPGRNADVNLTITDTTSQTYTYASGDDSSRPPGIIKSIPGKQIIYSFNAEGQIEEIITETCITSLATELDNCFQVGDDILRTTERLVYDGQGRPVRHINPEQNIETFAYDDAGNLTIYQDANGKTFSYAYDAFSRLQSVTSPTGIQLLLNYDALDRVIGICRSRAENNHTYQRCAGAGNVIESYTYDRLGRITSQTFPVDTRNSSIHYTYAGDMLTEWGLNNNPEKVTLTYNHLGQVETLTTDQDHYNFAYANFSNLEQSGTFSYTYDEYGRLLTVQTGGNTLIYTYAPNNQGYTITDEASQRQITFSLNERGLLTGIESGAQIEYFLNPDGRILIVQITREDGELVEIQLNRMGETQSVAYSSGSLFLNYTSDELGQVQRQRITGLSRYFEANASGYISVMGYDDDNRPLTMRITERESGQILYLLSITYNQFGQRETESRQLSDGTQITINYTYEGNQLTKRQITIKSKLVDAAQNGSPILMVLIWLGWVLRTVTQKRLFFAVLVFSIMVPLIFILSGAQQNNNTISFDYDYDNTGNLIQIRTQQETCAAYIYDNANRLIGMMQGEDTIQSYAYDAHNRLTHIGNQQINYQGDSSTIISINSSSPQFYAQTNTSPTLFQLGDETIWFTHDGRQNILSTSINRDSSIWLFDPLGRFFTLTESAESILTNPCMTVMGPPSLEQMPALQTFQNNAVWDTKTNLYFIDGRAYSPELRQFLQRDPLGPDVFGNVYAFSSYQTAIPIRNQQPHYTTGLYRLRDTIKSITHIDTLTASYVLASVMPTFPQQQLEELTTSLNQVKINTQEQLLNQLDLPVWLMTQYNLPAPYIDSDGQVQLIPDNAPGHGGLAQSNTPTSNIWLNPSSHINTNIDMPLYRLENIIEHNKPALIAITLYQTDKWQPQPPSFLQSAPIQTQFTDTPDAVNERLPHNLDNPLKGADILDIIIQLNELPNITGEDGISAALEDALPSQPILPLNSESMLSSWFSDDVFGIAKQLDIRTPNLPKIIIPIYDLGVNQN